MVAYLREEHLLGSEIVIITARAIQYAGITIEALRKFGIPFDRIILVKISFQSLNQRTYLPFMTIVMILFLKFITLI